MCATPPIGALSGPRSQTSLGMGLEAVLPLCMWRMRILLERKPSIFCNQRTNVEFITELPADQKRKLTFLNGYILESLVAPLSPPLLTPSLPPSLLVMIRARQWRAKVPEWALLCA